MLLYKLLTLEIKFKFKLLMLELILVNPETVLLLFRVDCVDTEFKDKIKLLIEFEFCDIKLLKLLLDDVKLEFRTYDSNV